MAVPQRLLLVIVLGLFPIASLLAQPQASFAVSATITEGCLVNNGMPVDGATLGTLGNLDFGTHSALSQASVSASVLINNSVSLNCTPGINLGISINGGLYEMASLRYMRNSSSGDSLTYELFADALGQQAIAIGVPVNVDTNTNDIQLPIHGRVNLPGNASPGLYQDTLTVTLEW